jgi:DNA repair protein RadC
MFTMKDIVLDTTANYSVINYRRTLTDLINPLNLPEDERPRERLFRNGPDVMSDRELLAIILNSGIPGKNVNEVANDLLKCLDQSKSIPSIEELSKLRGIGKSKACTIAAMLEFGRRRWGPVGIKILVPDDAYRAIRHYADRRQERFLSISLNGAHEIIAVRIVTAGLIDKTIVHPREVFSDPLSDRATAVIVAHNHPSGQMMRSPEDDEITRRLQKASKILGIRFLDHLIFSEDSYISYQKEGIIHGNIHTISKFNDHIPEKP